MGRPGACWGSRLPTEASLSPPGPQCGDLSASSLLLRGPCLFCDILMVSGRLTRLSGGSGMGTGAAPALARQDPGPRAPGSQTACAHPTSGPWPALSPATRCGAAHISRCRQPCRRAGCHRAGTVPLRPPPDPRPRAPCCAGTRVLSVSRRGSRPVHQGVRQARSAEPMPRPFARPLAPGITPEHTPNEAGEPAEPPGAPGGTFSKPAGLPAPPHTGCRLRMAPSPSQGPTNGCPRGD